RRRARAREPEPQDRAGRVRVRARPLRLRQVDAAAHSFGPAPPDRGPGGDRGPAGGRTAPGRRHRVPAGDPAAVEERAEQRAGADPHHEAPDRAVPPARAGAADAGRARGFRRALPLRALGRHAAAGRHRARAGARPGHSAHGRAVRRARRHDARFHDGGAAAHLAAHRQIGAVHHPLHPRSRVPVRSGSDAVGAPGTRDRRPADRSRPPAHAGHDVAAQVRRLLRAPARALHQGSPGAAGAIAMKRFSFLIVSLAFLLALLGIWHWAIVFFHVPPYLLPKPGAVVDALWGGLVRSGGFYPHIGATLHSTVTGYAIGCALALVAGTLLAEFPRAERLLTPYIVALQSMPKVALAPLIIVWFGYDIASKIVMVALICFFPVFVNTVVGLKSVDRNLLALYRVFSASRLSILLNVKVPAAAGSIFAGLQIAVVMALIGAVVAEFVASRA